MTKNDWLWVAIGVVQLLLGLFILTDLFDVLIEYVAYILIVLGVVVIVGTAIYRFLIAKQEESD